jgi:pimeloyl-ACP methyl ester carboxylesterase
MDMLTAPEKRVAIIPKAAHGCFFDQPEQFRQVLDEFLKFC